MSGRLEKLRRREEREAKVLLRAAQGEPEPLFDYHHPVFLHIYEKRHAEIGAALHQEPIAIRETWFRQYKGQTLVGEAAWKVLQSYSDSIESMIAEVVKHHSVFFWMHLYRRIGVMLSEHDNKRDALTLALVRDTLETAFTKYGDLTARDVEVTDRLTDIRAVMGGLWVRTLVEGGISESDLLANPGKFFPPGRFVLTRFDEGDLINAYRLEGLCYEHWLALARMRTVGKGGAIEVDLSGSPESSADDDLEFLLESYDDRIGRNTFDHSMVAVSFTSPESGTLPLLVAQYNVERRPFSQIRFDVMRDVDFADGSSSNFILIASDLAAYAKAHRFLADAFRRARGFELSSLCGYLSAVSLLCIGFAIDGKDFKPVNLMQVYQRGYRVVADPILRRDLRELSVMLLDRWLGKGHHHMFDDADRVHEFLTLSREKQEGVSLWTRGPRHLFHQYGDATVVDLQGVVSLLEKAFVRVAHDPDPKGKAFEDAFREFLTSDGFDVLPYRKLRVGGVERETDAAVRVATTLYLFECRAMEVPLDFERGRPATIAYRNAKLTEKVNQVLSLAAFVEHHPYGDNYDLSWAKNIVSAVVSPFVEWIWSREAHLWIDRNTPHILTVREAVDLLRRA